MAVAEEDAARNAPPPDPNKDGVFRSEDGGKTWTFMSNQNQRPTYFSQIRVDPVNDKKLFVGGNPGQMSLDGGKTWKGLDGSHTDYHAFWINPKDPRDVAVGHDGGVDFSYDGGFTWDYHNDIAVGQFYQVSADMRRPYYVCGGLQDNNAWCGPSAVRNATGAVNTDWFTISGGDGFYTRQDPTDWAVVYGESQDGNMSRHDLRTGAQKNIRPTAPGGRGANGPGAAAETQNEITRAANPPAGANVPAAARIACRRERWRSQQRSGSRRWRRPRRDSERRERAREWRAVPFLLERSVRNLAAQHQRRLHGVAVFLQVDQSWRLPGG